MFWRAWRLFAPDDCDGVDAKDICPSPNQLCLDDLEFVLRFGLNRRGDPVFALYILGHLRVPQEKPSSVARGSSNHRPAAAVGSKGTLRRLGECLPNARDGSIQLREFDA